MLTGIDSEYATGSRTNLKGETHYEHYSYTLATKKTIEGFNIFPTIMKFDSHILSHITDASGIYEIEANECINFLIGQREKQKTLNASMDSIA